MPSNVGVSMMPKRNKNLAQAITAALVELEQLDILLNNGSLLFKEAIWKVHAMFWLFYYHALYKADEIHI